MFEERTPDRVEAFLEELLEGDRKRYEDAAPPLVSLDTALAAGLAAGKRRRMIRGSRRRSLAGTAILLVLLFGLVRVSPAFASYMGGLPGIGTLIRLMAGDRGLADAVRNDFVQPVGIGDTHDGATFTIDGVIADEARINVLFTMRVPQAVKKIMFGQLRITDADTGESIKGFYGFQYPEQEGDPGTEFHGRIDIGLTEEGSVPDRLRIEVSPQLPEIPSGTRWTVDFPIDKMRFRGMKEVIPVGRTVTVQGQSFTVTQAVIHPTRIGLDIEMDPANSKRLFFFSELTLVNELGEQLHSQGASLTSAAKQTVYFESNFFKKPQHLTLSGSRIMALDKSKLKLKMDLGSQRILEAPDDRISITDVSLPRDGKVTVSLAVKGAAPDDRFGYRIVSSEFHDAAGRTFRTGSMSTYFSQQDSEQKVRFEADLNGPYENPLTFDIADYPSWIELPFTVRLK